MENIEKCGMKFEEAIKLLHPDTTAEVIAEIEYKHGFRGKQLAINKINEACVIACEAMEKQIPKKPIGKHTNYKCPVCDRRVRSGKGSSSFGVDFFCQRCGQALDWSDTE